MGTKTRKRPRDLPHPTHEPSKPGRTDFNGGPRRAKLAREGAERADGRGSHLPGKGRTTMTASKLRRIDGPNGSWPAHDVEVTAAPKPPALCMLYDDLAAGLEPAPVFGQYPKGLIAKLLPHLGCERREILHLCSGSLKRGEGIRVDIRPDAHPDVVADARELPRDRFPDGSVAAVMLDPPYSPEYAKRLYGVTYPRPAHLLREAVRVVRPGGVIAFVHYLVPMPPEGARFVRAWGLSTGFGFPMRAVSLWQRDQDSLPFSLYDAAAR